MNNDVELEGRPRPLSTGLWTLFSWLRRDDRSESSDSLSSAGSDRTVASFAFLTPAHYQPATAPYVLPPLGPPTDSYKKRVHDRNIRRQYDRDLTLHRKYGLLKSGEATCGYDAFSLPPVRRINGDSGGRWDRDRRATSECYQRRLAHVPGKRRAPLPPVSTAPTVLPTSLTRRNTRKRRAPQPPVKLMENNKENITKKEVNSIVTQMNPHSVHDKQKLRNNDVSMGCKPEKYSKKEGNKETKVKSEKSFLKQIFDSKKRNSGIDISSVKLLPSISELDKQAAQIIESCKLNASEQNNNVRNSILVKNDSQSQLETWICVNCLRKFNSSIITCLYCLPNQKVNPSDPPNANIPSASKAANSYTQTERYTPNSASIHKSSAEEKQKLKEMLKEMKDSLPKRTKHELNNKTETKTAVSLKDRGSPYSNEMPTLRVGCTVQNKALSDTQPSSSNIIIKPAISDALPTTHKQAATTTQPALAVEVPPAFKKYLNNNINLEKKDANKEQVNQVQKVSEQTKHKKDLHTPLKISSLLNPVYVPKQLDSNKPEVIKGLQIASNFEKDKIFNALIDNGNRDSQTTSNSTSTTAAVLASSSRSQVVPSRLPVSINKVEIKPKIEMEKIPIQPPVSLENDNLSVGLKKDKPTNLKLEDSKVLTPSSTAKEQNIPKETNTRDQHSRRRDLIHQLERSIAKGDENAAAEAAAKLAQLRLSCSVLSFSSQILSEPSTSSANTSMSAGKMPNEISAKTINFDEKVNLKPQATQLSSIKERSPQKEVVSSVTSSSALASNNVAATPAVTVELHNDKPLPNSQESIVKRILLEAKKENQPANDTMITISVLVEDKEATRGPVKLRIRRQALMRDLRRVAETSLGLATNLQRWIVGRVLCVNDNTPIISLAGTDFSAPFYLCVVESETKADPTTQTKLVDKCDNQNNNPKIKTGNVYTELVQLEQQALVCNAEKFECGVCMEEYTPGQGVVLRECVHIFCRECLADVVRHCEEPDIPCPAMGCRGMLQEREIRALVSPQDYERWLARGLAAAESGTRNAFHCRTRDCKGWALCEPGVQRFPCPVCKHINCVPCQAIHDGATCEQHRAKLKEAAASKTAKGSETDDGTRTLLNSLIAKGEALECPECSAIITKKWGCDWVKCSACKTEICWVTRGRRWGPGGKGDTSGGCRCGVDGKRCHPSCGYCH